MEIPQLCCGDLQSTIELIIAAAYNLLIRNPRWRSSMPAYEYLCLDCHKPFEMVLSLHQHDEQNPKCPHCGSEHVEQEAAAFFAVTSKKS